MNTCRPYQLSIIFGISGVGKTTACRAAVGDRSEFLHLSSSDLLKRVHETTGEDLRTAQADRLQANQGALADAVEEEALRIGAAHVLLDAHSVIDNDVTLVEIPVDAIAALRPTRMIFLLDSPEAICARRAADSRPRPVRTPAKLAIHQDASLAVVRRYENELNVPLFVIRVGDSSTLADALQTL